MRKSDWVAIAVFVAWVGALGGCYSISIVVDDADRGRNSDDNTDNGNDNHEDNGNSDDNSNDNVGGDCLEPLAVNILTPTNGTTYLVGDMVLHSVSITGGCQPSSVRWHFYNSTFFENQGEDFTRELKLETTSGQNCVRVIDSRGQMAEDCQVIHVVSP